MPSKRMDHFQVMKERTMFQMSPTKLAKRTWYCTGMNQKLMVDAIGQIFQLFSIVSQIFYRHTCTPLLNDFTSRSITTWLIGKNPVNSTGAKANWSNAIDPNTLTVLDTVGKSTACTLGSSLQYHRWSAGAMYPNPMMKKSMLRFQLKPLFSKTAWKEKYRTE